MSLVQQRIDALQSVLVFRQKESDLLFFRSSSESFLCKQHSSPDGIPLYKQVKLPDDKFNTFSISFYFLESWVKSCCRLQVNYWSASLVVSQERRYKMLAATSSSSFITKVLLLFLFPWKAISLRGTFNPMIHSYKSVYFFLYFFLKHYCKNSVNIKFENVWMSAGENLSVRCQWLQYSPGNDLRDELEETQGIRGIIWGFSDCKLKVLNHEHRCHIRVRKTEKWMSKRSVAREQK